MRPDCLNYALTKAEDSSSGGVGMASRRLEDDKCQTPAWTMACPELSKGRAGLRSSPAYKPWSNDSPSEGNSIQPKRSRYTTSPNGRPS
jgi:hypothetical protein